jgi:archaellum component FlaD/FlaE
MNVNPEDYDPEELRQMAAERRPSGRSGGRDQYEEDPASRRNDDPSTRRNGDESGRHDERWSFGSERTSPAERGASGDAGDRQERAAVGRGDGRGDPQPTRDEPRQQRGNPRPARSPAADALRSNQLEQLFLHQSAMIAEQMTKPYLATIPQKYAAERVIFDWLEFLVVKCGFKRTMDALRYYRTIDWITEDVEAALQDYLIGFSDDGVGAHTLDVDDHQLSLLYVARLASMN